MGVLGKVAVLGAVLVLVIAVALGGLWYKLSQPAPLPKIGVQYWGPGKSKADNPAIIPFKINVSTEALDDLRDRLELLPPLTAPLEEANFRYGFNSDFLHKVVQFWLNDYNWREREAYLNSLPQFKTQVAGLQIHFIHAKPAKVPSGVTVLPLLLLHGWPGSVREFYELIPLLTTPRPGASFVFEVVAPSLPGYGFSEGAAKKGLGTAQMAVVFKSLMERLNFKQFYVQGGDWGALIGNNIAILYPDSVLGFHSNMCFVNTPTSTIKEIISSWLPKFSLSKSQERKSRSFGERFAFLLEETGYMHLQATKPDTLGIALRDSPAGLAAYILEKFSTWTDPKWRSLPDGGLTKKYSLTNLFDNIMIYWITGSITTSMRLYSETFSKAHFALDLDRSLCRVPTACAQFRHEIDSQPECILKDKYVNLVQISNIAQGGHFAAFEEPQLLAEDIWKAVSKMRL